MTDNTVAGLTALQRRFARWALGQTEEADFAGLIEGPGLWVHRNTVRLTLGDALGDLFPVTRQVVGDDFFLRAAKDFLRQEPPRAATLLHWGGGYPAFLEQYAPAADLPYLPDLARLEWRRHLALHGPEATPLTVEDLVALPPEQADDVTLCLHPTAHLLVSDWPVLDLWQAHQTENGLDRLTFARGRQEILIVRPHAMVELYALPAGGSGFLAALDQGLAAAIAAAMVEHPTFDAGALLGLALRQGCFRSPVPETGAE